MKILGACAALIKPAGSELRPRERAGPPNRSPSCVKPQNYREFALQSNQIGGVFLNLRGLRNAAAEDLTDLSHSIEFPFL
jgi:hypothetical protein